MNTLTGVNEIHWEVTRGCNLRCRTCLISAGDSFADELTTDEALRALSVFKRAGVQFIYFTGGEPFFRSDFRNIIEAAVEDFSVEVISNGTRVTEDDLQLLHKYSIPLAISLDGATAGTNDRIRGKDSFREALNTIKRAIAMDIPVTLYFTLTKENTTQVAQMLELAERLDVRVHINELAMGGRALNNPLLWDTPDELIASRRLIADQVQKLWHEEMSDTDETCWVDGTTLYMDSAGRLYLCTEIMHRNPENYFGSIRNFPLEQWRLSESVAKLTEDAVCPHGVAYCEHVTLISRSDVICPLVLGQETVSTTEQLSTAANKLFQGIEVDCFNCKDRCCIGYVWALHSEVDGLLDQDVSLLQINDGPHFINSFELDENGIPDLSEVYPRCSLVAKTQRRCTIHTNKPLVCAIYPIGLETTADGKVVWALHRDCQFVRRSEAGGDVDNLIKSISAILARLSNSLEREILEVYKEVDGITAFPDGENRYFIVKEVK